MGNDRLFLTIVIAAGIFTVAAASVLMLEF
jgi:hypothetical protein